MAGAHGVDVVALHRQQVAAQGLHGHDTAAVGAEIVAVHALEHDAFAIEVHHAVFHFKPAEADALGNGFEHTAVRVAHGQQQVIEIRRLAAP